MALAERRTAASGGVQATVTTATGVWTEITTAMLNAGWTLDSDWSSAAAWPNWAVSTSYGLGAKVTANGFRYYAIQGGTSQFGGGGPSSQTTSQGDNTVIWEPSSLSTTTADAIYTSTGESGNDKIWARVWVNATWVNVELYQHFASNVKYNAFNCAQSTGLSTNQKNQQFDYAGATTINFAVIADKDSVFASTVSQANVRRTISFGNLRRFPGVIGQNFITTNAVTSGVNRTFTFATGNPIAAGYQLFSPVTVISQQTSGSASFVIPCFSSRIVALTSSSITVANVPENVAAGAMIGHDPQPLFCLYSQTPLGNPFVSNAIRCHNYTDDSVVNTYAVNGQNGAVMALTIPVRDSSITELDPNQRTGYFQVTEQMGIVSNLHPRGSVTKAYAWHTNTNNQWAIAREVRTTAKDWIFQRDTPPATGSSWIMGPFNATTATVNFQSYGFTDWGYQEVDLLPSLNFSQDRVVSSRFNSGSNQSEQRLFGATPFVDNNDVFQWTDPWKYPSSSVNRWFNGYLFTSEIYPFDTATATLGGSSNGFNTGFN